MKPKLSLIIPLLLICSFTTTDNLIHKRLTFMMPAEWEPHEAVWLGWNNDCALYQQPIIDIVKALHRKVSVKMIADSPSALDNLKAKLSDNGTDVSKILFYIIPDNKLWMRDHGALYLTNKKGQKKVTDFGWAFYGDPVFLRMTYGELGKVEESSVSEYRNHLYKTGQVDSIMGSLDGYPIIKSPLNIEGGAIEVNGKGTVIVSEPVLLERNPTLSKTKIESELKRVLGVSTVIWMKMGLLEDPKNFDKIVDNFYGWGTNGHTDEFVRFVDDNTILLAWIDEDEKDLNYFNQKNYERMNANLATLQKARNQDGKPFKIIKVPIPDPIYLTTTIVDVYDNDFTDQNDKSKWKVSKSIMPSGHNLVVGNTIHWVASASYLNYFVTNGTILLPSYTNEHSSMKKERKMMSILQSVFPKREIVLIDAMNLNYFGGGIHCVTQQEPKASISVAK